jgi:hypothetical protein
MASHAITLSPLVTTTQHGGGWSSVKSISFFLLFIGMIFITVGYIRSESRCPAQRVEFRYVPKTFEQEQNEPPPVMSIFGKMFSERDPWSKDNGFVDTFPWERANIQTPPTSAYQELGYGRAVGQKIIG